MSASPVGRMTLTESIISPRRLASYVLYPYPRPGPTPSRGPAPQPPAPARLRPLLPRYHLVGRRLHRLRPALLAVRRGPPAARRPLARERAPGLAPQPARPRRTRTPPPACLGRLPAPTAPAPPPAAGHRLDPDPLPRPTR